MAAGRKYSTGGRYGLTEHLKRLTKEDRLAFFVKYLELFSRVKRYGRHKGRLYNQSCVRTSLVKGKKDGEGHGGRGHEFTHEVCLGADYSPEQLEFMLAMHRRQERLGRKISDAEVLGVAKALGYQRRNP